MFHIGGKLGKIYFRNCMYFDLPVTRNVNRIVLAKLELLTLYLDSCATGPVSWPRFEKVTDGREEFKMMRP
jgi:hypothetical protein